MDINDFNWPTMETTENSTTTIANITFASVSAPNLVNSTTETTIGDIINNVTNSLLQQSQPITPEDVNATKLVTVLTELTTEQSVTASVTKAFTQDPDTTTLVTVVTDLVNDNLTATEQSVTKALTAVTNATVTEKSATVTEAIHTTINATITTTEKMVSTVLDVINGTDNITTTTEKVKTAGVHEGSEEKTLYIVLGIILAALFIILIVLIFVYRKYKGRSSSRSGVYSINNGAGSSRYNHNSC